MEQQDLMSDRISTLEPQVHHLTIQMRLLRRIRGFGMTSEQLDLRVLRCGQS